MAAFMALFPPVLHRPPGPGAAGRIPPSGPAAFPRAAPAAGSGISLAPPIESLAPFSCPLFSLLWLYGMRAKRQRYPPLLGDWAQKTHRAPKGTLCAGEEKIQWLEKLSDKEDRSACRRQSRRPRCPGCRRRPRHGDGRSCPRAGCAAPRGCAAWRPK